jgi:hypothetical protein
MPTVAHLRKEDNHKTENSSHVGHVISISPAGSRVLPANHINPEAICMTIMTDISCGFIRDESFIISHLIATVSHFEERFFHYIIPFRH